MRFARLPIENLRRRPMRTGLTMVGIGMAVAGFLMMMGLARGLERGWVGNFVERRTDVLVVRKGAVEILATSISASLVGVLRTRPEIADATAELIDLVPIDDGSNGVACGWPPDSYLWDTIRITAGRRPESHSREVVVGEAVAAALRVHPNDRIRLLDEDFTVVGISSQSGVLIGNAILMPLSTLQRLINRDGQVTAIHVRLAHQAGAGSTHTLDDLERLAAGFPGLTFTRTEDLSETNRILGLVRALAWIMSAIGLLMGVVVLTNTLLMSVAERTREIGTLTALGWSRGRVVVMILLEALVLALVGGLAGIGVGTLAIHRVTQVSVVRGFVEPDVSFALGVQTAVAAVVLGLAASAYPAWRAASMSTAAALRHE